MRPPAFQMYADDFIAGTLTMTNEEKGLYITLLCIQWNRGYVTDVEFGRLGRGMADESIAHVKAKFDLGVDGFFRNKRMESVRKEQDDYREECRRNGMLGAQKRYALKDAGRGAKATPLLGNGSPPPTPPPAPNTEQRERPFPEAVIPSWEEVKAMADRAGVVEDVAREFFNHYDALNLWWNKHGMPINIINTLKIWDNNNKHRQNGNKNGKNSARPNSRLLGQFDTVAKKTASIAATLDENGE